MGTLRLVLGDQLSLQLSSLTDAAKSEDVILLAEVREEATYVRHHKKKIAFLFAAMRHFAGELKTAGYQVRYIRLDDPANQGSLRAEAARALEELPGLKRLVVTKPGEWRLLQDMERWSDLFAVPVELRDDTRFIVSPKEFNAWASGRKQLRMEYFYREVRLKTGLLMDGDQPEGGQWNYDTENRKRLPRSMTAPQRFLPEADALTREVMALVAARFPDHFGDLEPWVFATTRAGAEQARDHFISEILPGFGDWQDAMARGEPWMWHSLLSVYLNCGLLDPLDVCRRAEAEWKARRAPLNAVEGFIRQIIGWREYVRGIYWLKMPGYAQMNALDAHHPLPEFYWTGKTRMRCMAEAIGQTQRYAYAHHIQRLMITGNFALLAGLSPAQVNEWYLLVYADAYEWVELPNTHGMALHADGGLMASKPYAASGNYISKMSDYCEGCSYDVKRRTGEKACPFNFLYWDFIARHEARFKNNPRMAVICKSLNRMSVSERAEIRAEAAGFLREIGHNSL
ncbi:MAG: cryptochrome/photolyase family protein [Hyphomonas sp.]|uniref:cryptochrome/photolyase family protein n=1 Tax=Hyphomonas sp. TaxID=87 RepID=UPI001DCC54A2|nr:cryptochrome/photolyase family protein [Hyphomonas sp.]MBA4228253.1 cryptochrome/photolyase family protein [Hyphomonas sp.]